MVAAAEDLVGDLATVHVADCGTLHVIDYSIRSWPTTVSPATAVVRGIDSRA